MYISNNRLHHLCILWTNTPRSDIGLHEQIKLRSCNKKYKHNVSTCVESTFDSHVVNEVVAVVIVWLLELQLHTQSVPNTTKVVSSNPLKFVSDL